MMIGELDAAHDFLHKAVRLAHQMHNNEAIIYTYTLMANLAFVQGQLDNGRLRSMVNYQEALALACAAGDGEAIEQLQEGLKELASRRDGQTESKPKEQELKK